MTVLRIGGFAQFGLDGLTEISRTDIRRAVRSEVTDADGRFLYPLGYACDSVGEAYAPRLLPEQHNGQDDAIDIALAREGVLCAAADAGELRGTVTIEFIERGNRHTVSGMPEAWWDQLEKAISSHRRDADLIYDEIPGHPGPTGRTGVTGAIKVADLTYIDFAEVASFGIAGSAEGYTVYLLEKADSTERSLITVRAFEVAHAIMDGLGWAKHTKQDVDLLELVARCYEGRAAEDGKG